MNLSNLPEGFDGIKDELTDEFKSLGSNVIDGKTNPMDALKEGEGDIMNKVKGLFGLGDKPEESKDDANDSKDDSDDDKDS